MRRCVGAGYWLPVGIAILALVAFVHFVPHQGYESLPDVYVPYTDPLTYAQMGTAPGRTTFFRDVYPHYASPAWAILVVVDLLSLVAALLVLIVTAMRVRRLSITPDYHTLVWEKS